MTNDDEVFMRDFMATIAMLGLILHETEGDVPVKAYAMADEMLKARVALAEDGIAALKPKRKNAR